MKKRWFYALAFGIVLINFGLLRYLNPLIWPYLWPRPGLFILAGAFILAIWFREYLSGIWILRLIGPLMIFLGQSYLLHSYAIVVQHFSLVALLHFIGFTGTFLVMVLNYFNQIRPKSNTIAPRWPQELPYVAAVIPTYGEPYDILEQTVISLQKLDYPSDRLYIFISDDGHRDEIRQLSALYGIGYNPGARKDAKAGNLNSALAHIAEHFPLATLVITQDADEIIEPTFLRKTVGYFTNNPKLAFVQTPKDAWTPEGDPFGNRDRVFYDILQPGRNGAGAAFSCGSGVLWNIAAVQSIGGYSTWNIVEDMTTSYFLHCAGYHSEYHNEILTIGLSPDDIPGLLKQRGTWAADTWRFFLFNNPLWKPGLRLAQRMQYFELGMFYVASTLFMPLLMLVPLLSLATDTFIPIEGSALFPWVFVSMAYYVTLAQGNLSRLTRMWQYWVGHGPTYIKAFWIAIRARNTKPSYKVTRKTRQNGYYGHLLWPQFLYLLISLIVIVRSLFWVDSISLSTRLVNAGIVLFFMFMISGICRASFYGVTGKEIVATYTQMLAPLQQRYTIFIDSLRPLRGWNTPSLVLQTGENRPVRSHLTAEKPAIIRQEITSVESSQQPTETDATLFNRELGA